MLRRLLWLALAVAAALTAATLLDSDRRPTRRAGTAPERSPDRCTATTSRGRRCARDAEPGSAVCWQHG